jgi:hypothetical protein
LAAGAFASSAANDSGGDPVAPTALPDDDRPSEKEKEKEKKATYARLGDQVGRRHSIADAMARVERIVGTYYPEALDPLKAALAVAAVGCFSDNTQPTTLVLVARSGAGKSMALNFLMPQSENDEVARYIYRSDKLTAASFVSHRADLTPEQLNEVDLLPRIQGKTMVSKELAPFFSGKRDELHERFAMVASVLDGTGFISDSGAQGRRGYAQPTNFQWLGATTPLSPEVLEVMAHVGPRILFYDADRRRKDIEELVEHARHAGLCNGMEACRIEVHRLLVELYRWYPPGTVKSGIVAFGDSRLRQLAMWADVLTRLRAKMPAQNGRNETDSTEQREPGEHAERVLGMLKNVAIGSALAHGCVSVEDYDLAQVGHVALSSGVEGRGRVFRALLASGGMATTHEVKELAGMSTPTALEHMRALASVGVARFTRGAGNAPARIRLVEPFAELCAAPLRKANRGEGGSDRA